MPFLIVLDGPAGVGKNTLGTRLAAHFGLHYLDSGLMYRRAALTILQKGVDPQYVGACVNAVTLMSEADLTTDDPELRSEKTGMMAAAIAPYQDVRREINWRIRHLIQREPGTILDGRAGASEFPLADIKLFVTASAKARAQRRFDQLIERGGSPDYNQVLADVKKRDRQDAERATAPMIHVPGPRSLYVDTSCMDAEQVFRHVLAATGIEKLIRK